MSRSLSSVWKLHGDGRSIRPGEVVKPDERLAAPLMLGLGLQHVLAMFGSTALVPVLTKFPVSTTIFFSGVGTILFVLITRNRVPSYTGSSFAFIAPVTAATVGGDIGPALGGIVVAGVVVFLIGLVIDRVGTKPLEWLLPPVVTGSIVALIGLNLAPVAKDQFESQAGIALVTLVAIVVIGVAVRGFVSSLSVFLGVVVGYVFAGILGKVDWSGVHDAAWFGFPDFAAPEFQWRAIVLIVPAVVLVLLAENAGHVKTVGAMTERDMDGDIGRSFMGDGLATSVSGLFGGSATTTYGENIGVMGLTRVYSTLAYVIAGLVAIALGLLPKFGAIVQAIPMGVLGGAVTVLFGLIAVLGARVWIDARVDFRDPVNLITAAVAITVGAANYTLVWGDYSFAGIALGTVAAIVTYRVLKTLQHEDDVPPPPAGVPAVPPADPVARG